MQCINPIYYNDLQAYLPSSVRATMLSINSMMFSLSMIVIFPLTGWLIDTCGFVAVFLVLGLITLFSYPLLLIGLGKMGKILNGGDKDGIKFLGLHQVIIRLSLLCRGSFFIFLNCGKISTSIRKKND